MTTTLTLCPVGWRLFGEWHDLMKLRDAAFGEDNIADLTRQANAAWKEYQDHKNGYCPECRKDEG
jgi:hypothetical protein